MSSTTAPPAYSPEPMTPDRTRKWYIPGKEYRILGTPGKETSVDANLVIPEADGLNMGSKKQVYGEPVNARLAIFYIRKLWQEVEDKRLLNIHDDTHTFFEKIKSQLITQSEPFDKEEFLKELQQFDNRWKEANNWLIQLLRNSFAITMERSILLKTLSQPECEGMRYYLAMKKKNEDKTKIEGEIYDKDDHPVKLTLVTVGVDREGNDLHFEYEPRLHSRDRIPDVENESLCTEYPRTPEIEEKYKVGMPELKPYVLFKYAMVRDEA